MKKHMIILGLLLAVTSTWAQPRNAFWARHYGGHANEIFWDAQRTSDGNYILCGATESYGSGQRGNGWVVKINPQGDTLWTRAFDAGMDDAFFEVRELSDGSFILGGIKDCFPIQNCSQAWLLKLSATGDSLWSHFYNHNNAAHNYLERLEPLSSGGFVFAGVSGASIWYTCDVWIVLTDSDGNAYVNKTFNRRDCDIAFSVREIADGFMVAGLTRNSQHSDQAWLLKLDANADTVWTRTFSGPCGNQFYDLVCTADSGYALTGPWNACSDWTGQTLLMKVNANGDSLWSHSYGALPFSTEPQRLMQTPDGGFVLAGTIGPSGSNISGDMYLVCTDSEGNLLWSRRFGGPNNEQCNGLVPAYDGGYLLAGPTNSYGSGEEGYVVKTEPEEQGRGYMTLASSGSPDWDYELHWVSGSIQFVTFPRVCEETHGLALGDAQAQGWTAMDFGNSVTFWTPNPLTSGSLETFRLNSPTCSGQLTWIAGDSTGSADGPLPVELLSFSAESGDRSVTLYWKTASETNNNHFEIMRNGARAAQVLSQGNTATGHEYSWTDQPLENGVTYTYTLFAVDDNGATHQLGVQSATLNMTAAVIAEYTLRQNFPNPFNPATTIDFDLKENGLVKLSVYSVLGQKVANLANSTMEAGRHSVSFDAGALPSGVYICRLEVNGYTAVRKMMLMR